MVRFNSYISEQEIGGPGHLGFRRIFNQATPTHYGWNKGGRIYSVGKSNYQQAPKEDRAGMTINGEPVVELDIRASYLTIFHALKGVPINTNIDPYSLIEGLDRKIAKIWVVMTLGHNKYHRRWPDEVKEEQAKRLGGELQKLYPIGRTKEVVIAALPILKDWHKSAIRWPELQYVESCVLMGTVEELAYNHNIPCLPVHDSIIVPKSGEERAKAVLIETFEREVGVRPHVEAKRI